MMQFFNPDLPSKQKEESHHPWERSIDAQYSNTYKYGHNSANNPIFPPKKEKTYNKRIQFIVIGNRLTKDFIYCYYLVTGLYKYRQDEFEPPVIRGMSGVEWPHVLMNLKREYGGLAYAITSGAAVLIGDRILGGRQELKEYVSEKYVYHLSLDYAKEGIQQFANYIKSSGRPCAYFHISINDECIGSLIFMLYSDIVPLTCQNFLNLCDATKGGYTGTPIHRIVKDCWIQCGGFGLKSTSDLECENFHVPHDRRGVLCMANDGRHVDCSTQFFVLLQPAPWMAGKYVAFGQLIEGEGTLRKIEEVPTWYESPTYEVIIYKAGVFNMDCQHIPVNKRTLAYLQGHTENLVVIGEMFYEELMQKVFTEIQLKYLSQLEALKHAIEGEEEGDTETYQKKRAEIEKQLAEVRGDNHHSTSPPGDSVASNNEFDVEMYEYEIEEYSYKHIVSVDTTPSIEGKPEKPFYIPLTDVPYPGEVPSTYELRKKLLGDYCHETDMEVPSTNKKHKDRRVSIPAEALAYLFESYKHSDDDDTESSLDSDDEREIGDYLRQNTDRASFAGGIVKKMAHKREKFDVFDHSKDEKLKRAIRTDEQLRMLRLATREIMRTRSKKVSMALSSTRIAPTKIKRRQTGFIHPKDLQKIHELIKSNLSSISSLDDLGLDLDQDNDDDDDDDDDNDNQSPDIDDELKEELFRQVRIAPTSLKRQNRTSRAQSFAPRTSMDLAYRPTALSRLFDEVIHTDEDEPTLKDYRPVVEGEHKSFLLLTNPRLDSNELTEDRYLKLGRPQKSIDYVLHLQHGPQFRKISSDYVRTIDTLEQSMPHSIRTVEFSKTRPSISIHQYKLRNQQYKELLQAKAALEENEKSVTCRKLRLPGDSPIHNLSAVSDCTMNVIKQPKTISKYKKREVTCRKLRLPGDSPIHNLSAVSDCTMNVIKQPKTISKYKKREGDHMKFGNDQSRRFIEARRTP